MKCQGYSAFAMRPSDARAARRWAAERERIHEHNLAARREAPADVVVLVIPALHGAPGWTEWRGQLNFPAIMRDAALKAGTLLKDPYAHLYGTEERT